MCVNEFLRILKISINVPRKDESKNRKSDEKSFLEIELVSEKIIKKKNERGKTKDRTKHNGSGGG